MSDKKQTAVEFAVEKLEKFIPSGNQLIIHIILEQAKEMEKQQQEYFFRCGRQYQLTGEGTFTEVYNETYEQ
jgi:hypothetical protein